MDCMQIGVLRDKILPWDDHLWFLFFSAVFFYLFIYFSWFLMTPSVSQASKENLPKFAWNTHTQHTVFERAKIVSFPKCAPVLDKFIGHFQISSRTMGGKAFLPLCVVIQFHLFLAKVVDQLHQSSHSNTAHITRVFQAPVWRFVCNQ